MRDRRAVAGVVGAVLLFGILVISLSLYQAQVVPAENKQLEYQHSQQVQDQLVDVRNGILRTAASGNAQPVSVTLGMRYPTRVLFVNPPPVTGTLRTQPMTANLSVRNIRATDEETAQYVNGTLSFDTKRLAYDADYNEYREAPRTVYANGLVYNDFGRTNLTVTDQSMLAGNRVTLVTLTGDYRESGVRAQSVDPQPSSAPYHEVTVTNRSAGPLVLSIPSRLPASRWAKLLEDQTAPEGRVLNVSDGTNATVEVRLKPGTYVLQLARVGVGRNVRDPGPEYVTTVSGNGATLPEGGSATATIQVRDRYNNPVGGVDVNTSTPEDGEITFPNGDVTNAKGEVTLKYHAPDSVPGDTPVTIYAGFGNESVWNNAPRQRVAIDMTVTNRSTDGGGGSGGGGTASMTTGNARTFWGNDGVTFDLANVGDDTVNIVALNVTDAGSADRIRETNGGQNELGQHEIFVESPTTSGRYEAGDGGSDAYVIGTTRSLTRPVTVEPGDAASLSFYAFQRSDGSKVNMKGTSLTVSVIFDVNGTRTTKSYTVTPS
ncbi:Ig-like domain-containing protein [Halarchaeum sp. P4]|uniref:Ig-like domain-containing protein n=1 Tax=Halarchaeum sp. P4 TaxID=3421639 RepID=UPI003EB6E470